MQVYVASQGTALFFPSVCASAEGQSISTSLTSVPALFSVVHF